jgi:GT2 family glycosyltransferase
LANNFDISIIMVSYDCLNPLKDCLKSITTQTGVSLEIIVIDNDSKDGTSEFLKSQSIYSLFPMRNLGFGAAVNLASNQAIGKYLFILNPDTILTNGCLASFLEFAKAHPDFGLASAHLIYESGQTQISARNFPTRRDLLFGRGSPLYRLGLAREKDAGYLSSLGETPLQVPAISATALFVRADLFRELGGFDERFFMYMEDLDLCKRVSDRSFPIWILPEVRVIHAWRKSSATRPYFSAWHHHLSVYKYFQKHYSSPYNIGLAVALVAGLALTFGMVVFRKKG